MIHSLFFGVGLTLYIEGNKSDHGEQNSTFDTFSDFFWEGGGSVQSATASN